MRLTRRDFLKATGATLAVLGASAPGKKEGPILIGDLEPLTGPYAAMGQHQRDGVLFGVEEINAKGGVLGREVKIVSEDDGNTPSSALAKANKVLDNNKVNFLLGSSNSAVALALSKLALERKVLYLGANGYADELTTVNCNPYFFRTCPSATMFARSSGAWMATNLGKTWHFITADYAWGHSTARAMKAVIESKGGRILANELVPMGTADFSAHLLKVRNTKPDILCVVEVGLDSITCLKQIIEFGMQKEFKVVGPALMYEDAVAVKPFVGYWGVEWSHTIATKETQDFVARYKKRFNYIPTTHSWAGRMASTQLLLGVERAKSTDAKAVIKALEDGHELTPAESLKTGKAYWRPWDHQLIGEMYLVKAKAPAEQRKLGDFDLFEMVTSTPGDQVAHARSESQCKMVGA